MTIKSCGPERGQHGAVSLPVLGAAAHLAPKVRKSRMSRWRAAALIGVNVIMLAHIAQWLIMGLTLSPLEPSESMYTLEAGLLNAGFVLFALAILSTLVFGRFFCGWGCHIVALQDLCAWVMKKCGVHPKPFRSRLMVWAPLLLALYMFVWPTFRREVLIPVLHDDVNANLKWAGEVGEIPAWLGDASPFPGLKPHFIVSDYWATFTKDWYVIVPYLLVCGFACVYFLGSKGFCTYGCPYGGFFGPADLSASLGHLGNASHPDVLRAIDDGIAAVRAAGQAAGILATNPERARGYLAAGVLFVAVGFDTTLLARGARSLAADFGRSPPP